METTAETAATVRALLEKHSPTDWRVSTLTAQERSRLIAQGMLTLPPQDIRTKTREVAEACAREGGLKHGEVSRLARALGVTARVMHSQLKLARRRLGVAAPFARTSGREEAMQRALARVAALAGRSGRRPRGIIKQIAFEEKVTYASLYERLNRPGRNRMPAARKARAA